MSCMIQHAQACKLWFCTCAASKQEIPWGFPGASIPDIFTLLLATAGEPSAPVMMHRLPAQAMSCMSGVYRPASCGCAHVHQARWSPASQTPSPCYCRWAKRACSTHACCMWSAEDCGLGEQQQLESLVVLLLRLEQEQHQVVVRLHSRLLMGTEDAEQAGSIGEHAQHSQGHPHRLAQSFWQDEVKGALAAGQACVRLLGLISALGCRGF